MKWLAKKTLESVSSPGMAVLAALVICISFIWVFELLFRAETDRIEAQQHLQAISYGNILNTRVNRDLNALLFLSSGLKSYVSVYHQELEHDKLQAMLLDLYDRNPMLRNLAVAVGYRITYVAPIKGNEGALGLYYPDVPEQWPQVQAAIKSRSGILVGPVNLVQGGRGLIYRYPIFVDGKYWGLLSTVINTELFLGKAFGDQADREYAFAVRTLDHDGKPGEVFYGQPQLFGDARATLMENEVPGGRWQYALLNKTPGRSDRFIWAIRLISYAVSGILGILMFIVLRDRATLAYQAMYDSLTGLANRRLLVDRIDQSLKRLERDEDGICAVFFFDLDDFKKINDRFGHRIGDIVLTTVAERVRGELRGSDTVARLGGDEFVVVTSDDKDSQYIRQLEDRLRKAIHQTIPFDGFDLHVGASIGVAIYPHDGDNTETLLKTADQRMYLDKQQRSQTKSQSA